MSAVDAMGWATVAMMLAFIFAFCAVGILGLIYLSGIIWRELRK